jgi:hypothetical protein
MINVNSLLQWKFCKMAVPHHGDRLDDGKTKARGFASHLQHWGLIPVNGFSRGLIPLHGSSKKIETVTFSASKCYLARF